eukprot:5495856-Pyramimonas_sp.AAC.1
MSPTRMCSAWRTIASSSSVQRVVTTGVITAGTTPPGCAGRALARRRRGTAGSTHAKIIRTHPRPRKS